QSVADIEVSGPAAKVVGRQKKLRGPISVLMESVVVLADEMRLADGGGGLQMGQVVGAPVQFQQPDSRTDRSAGDEHHPPAGSANRVHLRGEGFEAAVVERVVVLRENVCADFDDERSGRFDDFAANQIGKGSHETIINVGWTGVSRVRISRMGVTPSRGGK